MNILIYANCQAGQLLMLLSLMLRGKAKVVSVDINSPQAKAQLQSLASANADGAVDCVLTNQAVDDLLAYFSSDKIIPIPTIHFGGFHPDVVYFAKAETPSQPLFFKSNPTISALALWGYLHNLSADNTLALYREEVFEKLGYMEYFDVCCQAIVENFAQHGMNVGLVERFIASRKVFMYGPLHPRLELVISLCMGICERINLRPVLTFDELNNMLPDPLQGEYAWGCFPPLASRLGVPGSWLIRHHNEVFPTLGHYIRTVFAFWDNFPPGSIQLFDKDKARFDELHNIDEVLGCLL